MNNTDIEKERDLLIAQLHGVQERLEELYIESQKKDETISSLESGQEDLKVKLEASVAEFHGFKASLADILSEVGALGGEGPLGHDPGCDHLLQVKCLVDQKIVLEKKLTSSESIREGLLDQLHNVQEQFENCYLGLQEKTELVLGLEEKIKGKNKKLQKLSQKKREAVDRCLALELELNKLRVAEKPDAEVASTRSRSVRLLGRPILKRSKKPDLESKEVALIRSSNLFDGAWYLANNADVADSGIDPALHYYLYGAEDRRDPSPHFSTEWYLNTYPDVAQAKINPLLHYLTAGEGEGRVLKAV